jgi:hypothetical protein
MLRYRATIQASILTACKYTGLYAETPHNYTGLYADTSCKYTGLYAEIPRKYTGHYADTAFTYDQMGELNR